MHFSGKFVLDLIRYTQKQGLKSEGILDASNYSEAELETVYVDYNCIDRVFELIRKELNDPHFGLNMGEQISLQATAYIDKMMDTSSTVEEAFNMAITYSKLISDSMECSLVMMEDSFKVNFKLNPDWSLKSDYAIIQNLDLALLCAKNSLFRLTETEYFPSQVNLFYPRPKKLTEYYRLFNTHLEFNQEVSSIVFSKHVLEKSSVFKNKGLLQNFQEQAKEMINQLPGEKAILTQTKRIMLENIKVGLPAIEHVAAQQNLSVRMLQRKLKTENLSFKKLQNQLRYQLIRKMYSSGNTNLDEIAYLVGFSDSSALNRAFKSWTGYSPAKYFKAQL